MKKEKRTIIKININDVVQDTAQPRQDWAKNEKALLSLTEDIRDKGMYTLLLFPRLLKRITMS